MTRYEHGAKGWVGRRETRFTRPSGAEGVSVTWWLGPSWAGAYGPLDMPAAVYPTKKALEDAARGQFGPFWRERLNPQRVADAEAENLERWISYWEQVCAEAGVKVDTKCSDAVIAGRHTKRNEGKMYPIDVTRCRANYRHAAGIARVEP